MYYYRPCLCPRIISHARAHTQKEESSGGSGGSGAGYNGSGSGSGSSSGCHDEVDFTLCFEDTAVLYGVCLVAWVLGGLAFLCAPYHRKRLRISYLHLAKIVCTISIIHISTVLLNVYILGRGWVLPEKTYQISFGTLAQQLLLPPWPAGFDTGCAGDGIL